MNQKYKRFVPKNKKEKIIFACIIIIIFLLLILSLFIARNINSLDNYDMSLVSLTDKTETYDGTEHSLEIEGELPDGVSVSYTYNGEEVTGVTDTGTHTVVASFVGDNTEYNEIDDLTAVLIIENATFDLDSIVFSSETVTYDGEIHSIEATNMPTGTIVSYTYNEEEVIGVSDAGTYIVVATFTLDNYTTTTSTATLIINPATLDLTSVEFDDETVTYDGEIHSIEASNIPSGVNVSYTYNENSVTGVSAAGTYIVVATFTLDNYTTETLTSTLTINSAELDLTSVSLSSDTVQYDGFTHSLTVSDLPEGASVSYTYNGDDVTEEKDVDTYTVIAIVTNSSDNYSENSITLTSTLTITETTDYSYSISSGTDVYLTDYTGSETDITTPKEICVDAVVYTVIGLEENCFNSSSITSIVVSEGVITIGDYCFEYCADLISATISNSVTTVGIGCFAYCTKLESVSLPNGLTAIESGIFNECESLKSISIPSTITVIASYAFRNCIGLTNVVFEDESGLLYLKYCCFEGCSSLESITLPSTLKYIVSGCFNNCSSLTSITFEDSTSKWETHDSSGNEVEIDVTDPEANATYLTVTYVDKDWSKVS